jgi:hypothetical protein
MSGISFAVSLNVSNQTISRLCDSFDTVLNQEKTSKRIVKDTGRLYPSGSPVISSISFDDSIRLCESGCPILDNRIKPVGPIKPTVPIDVYYRGIIDAVIRSNINNLLSMYDDQAISESPLLLVLSKYSGFDSTKRNKYQLDDGMSPELKEYFKTEFENLYTANELLHYKNPYVIIAAQYVGAYPERLGRIGLIDATVLAIETLCLQLELSKTTSHIIGEFVRSYLNDLFKDTPTIKTDCTNKSELATNDVK